MKHLRTVGRLFLIAILGLTMASCATLGGLISGDGNASIFLTSPEAGTTVTITNESQVITIEGTVSDDVESLTVNPNGTGVRPATLFAGTWSVDITVSANDYTIEVIAKDANGLETKATYSFTVVYEPSATNSSSST